ncbi:nucleoside deaminase [Enterococcus sp. HY326]|uniref:nucleoside deaminase n=1 Tax=Enterococcus sp. HY326 TaxID=2971265 RepID=UPI00223F5F4A|nr:nucleoside deaminase [Enterococcus sp. HY326]
MNQQHPNKKIMRDLINLQRKNNSIMAAVINNNFEIVSLGRTTVITDNDPTGHAEINAIRSACQILNTAVLPKGYWLYSTFEPCPLCSSGIIWAHIDGVVYANNPRYRGKEMDWSFISCHEMLKKGSYIHSVKLIEDFLVDEIKDYFL